MTMSAALSSTTRPRRQCAINANKWLSHAEQQRRNRPCLRHRQSRAFSLGSYRAVATAAPWQRVAPAGDEPQVPDQDFAHEFERLFVSEAEFNARTDAPGFDGASDSLLLPRKAEPKDFDQTCVASGEGDLITRSDGTREARPSSKNVTPCCRAVWRSAVRNCRDERVWEKLLDEVTRHLLFLKPQDVLLLYYGLARVKYRDRKFLKELSFLAVRHASEYAPRGLALILNAFRKLELVKELDTFQLLLQSYLALQRSWTAWDLALVCNAAAHFHLYEPRLWKLVNGKKLCIVAREMRPQGLSLLAAAMARLDWRDGGVLSVIAKAALKQSGDFAGRNLAVLYAAFCKLDFDAPKLYAALERTAVANGYVEVDFSCCGGPSLLLKADHDVDENQGEKGGCLRGEDVGTGSRKDGGRDDILPAAKRDRDQEEDWNHVDAEDSTAAMLVTSAAEEAFLAGKAAGRRIVNVSWSGLGDDEAEARRDEEAEVLRRKQQEEAEDDDMLAQVLSEDFSPDEEDPDDLRVLAPRLFADTNTRGMKIPIPGGEDDSGATGAQRQLEDRSADGSAKRSREPFDLLAVSMLLQAAVCFTKAGERNPQLVRALLQRVLDSVSQLRPYHLRKLRSAFLMLKHERHLRRLFAREVLLFERDCLPRERELHARHVARLDERRRGAGVHQGTAEGKRLTKKQRDQLRQVVVDEEQTTTDFYLDGATPIVGSPHGAKQDGTRQDGMRDNDPQTEAAAADDTASSSSTSTTQTKAGGVHNKITCSRWKRELFDIVENELRVKLEPKPLVHVDQEDYLILPERKTVLQPLGAYCYYSDTTERTALSKLHTYLLEIQGYTVLHIPYYEWGELKIVEDKVLYLVSKGRRLAQRMKS